MEQSFVADTIEGLFYVQRLGDCLFSRTTGHGYDIHKLHELIGRRMTFPETELLGGQNVQSLEVVSYAPLHKPFKDLRHVTQQGDWPEVSEKFGITEAVRYFRRK